ncbi:hypothetical protein GOBAR_DD21454 [Gossypium barbadense]|nr:hypothetical protein GOBAR_DD21454 [Gossypium barbadense]
MASSNKKRIYKKISELSTLCSGDIPFIIFSSAGKPYSFGHPSIEPVTKQISNASQRLNDTIDSPVETYCKIRTNFLVQDFNELNLRELYEQDECFTELINSISVKRDKKIAAISSMHPPMDEDLMVITIFFYNR